MNVLPPSSDSQSSLSHPANGILGSVWFQQIMIEWNHTLPRIPLAGCESELWLSLDGGSTFMWITFLAPTSTSLLWTVPNTPTNSAVLDIRFGCDLHYPESYAP